MTTITHTSDGHPIGGWNYENEDFDALAAASSPFALSMLGDVSDLPEEFDLQPNRSIKNQQQEGSCEGHSLSDAMGVCIYLDSGENVDLSRDCAYYWSQEYDGGNRGDNGATLAGGRRVATERGLPPETLWPYSDSYNPRPPVPKEQLLEAAAPNKIARTTVLNDVDGVVNWMATGQGPVQLGITWGGSVDSNGIFHWSPGRGGHALYLRGRKKIGGRPCSILVNSWGTQWGAGGLCYLTDDTLAQMLRARWSVFQGLSGMLVPRRRFITFDRENVKWV